MCMKTNIVMYSPDRILYGVHIRQETKTGFFNLSDLQEAYNKARIIHGWSKRDINDVLRMESNHERLFYLLEDLNIIKVSFVTFMEMIKRQGITNTLKSYGVYRTSGARESRSTWCNPYIWVLVTMEMNPILYAKAVRWLSDKLILNRIEAGDMYKGLTAAVCKFPNVDYSKLAKGLNHVVFDFHESGIRNRATESQLKELENIERQMAFAIDMGYIKSFDQLIEALRVMWHKNQQKKLKSA